MKSLYAHIRSDGERQTVSAHLEGSAELCASFAADFHAREMGYLTGLLHDIGKYSDAFQQRLLNDGAKVDHSTAGAVECLRQNQPYAAFCVAGHHSGLPDGGSRTDGPDQSTLMGRMNRAARQLIPDYSLWKLELPPGISPCPALRMKNKRDDDFFTRMLFSCLTDADYLDTERFMSDGSIERDPGETLPTLSGRLTQYVAGWFPPQKPLNEQRCNILQRCFDQGDDQNLAPGIFTLTVPTGGGKTVASLAFALHHAITHGKKRIIYVIPYTSIIEQTADIFRGILGASNVLEHHSGVLYDAGDEANTENYRMMLAAENWDKPVIVTTAVQFFESIYSNRSSRCRKLHNLVNSVIIFDEAQMIPLEHLRPCVSAIAELVENYGASAVLCTATQPALEKLIHEFLPEQTITELCPEETYDSELFRRVHFKDLGAVSWASIADQLRESQQVLCIVNTRKSAKELFSLLENAEGSYHLSTMMVPAHRRKVLSEIRERLKDGRPCRVVSTSLIEAGVDVDFPSVLREVAGLDSMLQAAGRCNREGTHSAEESTVFLFRSEASVPPQFQMNADIGNGIIRQYEDIASAEAISHYFTELLLLTGEKAQDRKQILPLIDSGSCPFTTIAEEFRLIESNTRTVYIPWGRGAELIEQMKRGDYNRGMFREAAQYAVPLYSEDFFKLSDAGDVLPIDEQHELWYLGNMDRYSDADGIQSDPEPGRAIFH